MTGKNGLHHMFDRMKKYIMLLHVQYEWQNRIEDYILVYIYRINAFTANTAHFFFKHCPIEVEPFNS